MSLVKLTDKKSGTVYVYESESYWDKEKKAPRNRRKLIGKLDENGNIVPTGRKKNPTSRGDSEHQEDRNYKELYDSCLKEIEEKDRRITELIIKNEKLSSQIKKDQKIFQQIGALLITKHS